MTTKVLTVHNAEIKTAAVEIRTLTISGKQVTLAVFRQLRSAPLIAEDGTFNGLPWGVVNYHPDKCADASEHLHVVWQSGTELRRAAESPPTFSKYVWPDVGEDWLDAALLDGWRPHPLDAGARRPDRVLITCKAGTAAIDVDPDSRSQKGVADALWPRSWHRLPDEKAAHEAEIYQSALTAIRTRRQALLDEGLDLDREKLAAEMEQEVADEVARRERHRQRWAEIQALPQLFIAV